MPIIHFLMEFRLRPLSGLGEDWVSLVIPFRIVRYIVGRGRFAISYQKTNSIYFRADKWARWSYLII